MAHTVLSTDHRKLTPSWATRAPRALALLQTIADRSGEAEFYFNNQAAHN